MTGVLDQRTLILMLSLLYLVLPLAVWLALKMPRSPGPVLWCTGGLLGGVGFALMGLRGLIPDAMSYLVGQTALIAGAMLANQSLRLDLGRPWPWRWLGLIVVGYAVLLEVLLQFAGPAELGVAIRLFNLVAIAAMAHTAWQVSQAESSRNARTIAGAYAVQCLTILLNLTSALLGSAEIHTMQGALINRLAYFLMILVALIGYMAYLGLALERSARATLQLIQNNVRAEQGRKHRQALVRADRERLLNMLTSSLSQGMAGPLGAAAGGLRRALADSQQAQTPTAQLQHRLLQVRNDILSAHDTVKRMRSLIRPAAVKNAPLALDVLLHDVQQLIAQRAARQHTQLQFPAPPRLEIQGDPMTLTHALLQLLENAMAAVNGRPHRTIRVTVERQGEVVALHIDDNGPGFPEPVLQRLSQHNEPATPSLQGIGLFVVQSIMRQHRGQVLLSNPASGGARASLLLPTVGSAAW